MEDIKVCVRCLKNQVREGNVCMACLEIEVPVQVCEIHGERHIFILSDIFVPICLCGAVKPTSL